MSIPRSVRALVVSVMAGALLIAGCGDSESDAEGGATSTEAAGTIVDVAAGNPDFSILVAAVQKAGLAETLSGEGPFTVFAPTDAAFEAALGNLNITQDELLASPDLGKILTYHVVPEKVMAADITGTLNPTTVEGSTLSVMADSGGVTVGSDATVVTADVPASNGVIHAIDAVLIPPTVDLG